MTQAVFKPRLDAIEERLGYKFPRKGNNALNLTRDDAIIIVEQLGMKSINEYREEFPDWEPAVFGIHDAKGGIGKSTLAATLSTESSFDIKNRPRTLLFDVDPQGSQRHQFAPEYQSDKTVGQLIIANIDLTREERLEPEKQAEFRDYLLGIITDTHAEGVSLLPSFALDKTLNVYLGAKLGSGVPKDQVISCIKDIIITPLKNDFDLFFVDCNPSVDVTLYCVYNAINHLIIPVTARTQDTNAYCEYFDVSNTILNSMVTADFKGFKSIKTLINKNVKTNKEIYKRSLAIASGTDCYSTVIYESKAYEDAAANNLPLQLMNHTSRNSKAALTEAKALYFEVMLKAFSDLWSEVE
ncbi:ParA family protein [Vibrio mediterranei]